MKTFDNDHRQNDKSVLMRFVSSKKAVCHIPDQGGFLFVVDTCLADPLITVHSIPSPSSTLFGH